MNRPGRLISLVRRELLSFSIDDQKWRQNIDLRVGTIELTLILNHWYQQDDDTFLELNGNSIPLPGTERTPCETNVDASLEETKII